ncbi:MAG: hypothetical protein IKB43_03600 [Fibrobacter sp.]|jgi:hypothetical protein|uniref:hypothetical protein n=1 Tax=Fibrobacter sp. TaxID=35828 RepID=UPI001564A582|nr:hypothetical protein [Fibrobacter sp.]MBR2075065.1 hypothetical protein [Fibrobacter sp.]MBR2469225.1 hypothetical protein [Fibrobacter sp.]MBR2898118.1 hypothetical protein [Fibrobacter sp.]MBR3852338.1 hypothetical protein [Fibrobacter sp.]
MMKETLFEIIRKCRFNISIYTAEIFERRCQEEIIRSDEDKSSFVYLEFDFKTIKEMLKTDEQNEIFWEVFLESLTKNSRGSDIIGFLENNSGLGMLLLDSKLEGWNRVRGRIEQIAQRREFSAISLILPNAVRPIVYPACIQDESEAAKTGT